MKMRVHKTKNNLLKRKYRDFKKTLKNITWKSLKEHYGKIVQVYFFKLIYMVLYGMLYILVLRLFGFKLTFLNFLSSIALYFVFQDLAYFLNRTLRGKTL